MAEYISRESIGLTDFEIILCQADENKYKSALVMLLDKIEKLPAADVRENKRGKWDLSMGLPHCPFCGNAPDWWGQKYCGYCGADMREEQT